MGWVFILLFAGLEPEDICEIYLMDMNIAKFSPSWELAYDSVTSGFRTSQGCLDLKKWYQFYEIKFSSPLYKNFGVRYKYLRLDDYGINKAIHRVDPYLQINKDIWLFLTITPNFLKRDDEIGAGIGHRENELNYIELFFILRNFSHNFGLIKTRPGPEYDPYHKFPYKFLLRTRRVWDWFRIKSSTEFVTKAKKVYVNPADPKTEIFNSFGGETRIELSPFSNLWIGTMINFYKNFSNLHIFNKDYLAYDSLSYAYIEPFLDLKLNEKYKFIFEYTYTIKTRNTDTSSYFRNWWGVKGLFNFKLLRPWIIGGIGYQHTTRETYLNNKLLKEGPVPKQNRLLLTLEFRFPSGAFLVIKEGIELDGGWRWILRRPHNHTYVQLYVPIKSFSEYLSI